MAALMRRVACVVGFVVLVACLVLLPAAPARAAGTVTNCTDSGAGSLRAAIAGGGR